MKTFHCQRCDTDYEVKKQVEYRWHFGWYGMFDVYQTLCLICVVEMHNKYGFGLQEFKPVL